MTSAGAVEQLSLSLDGPEPCPGCGRPCGKANAFVWNDYGYWCVDCEKLAYQAGEPAPPAPMVMLRKVRAVRSGRRRGLAARHVRRAA